MPDTECEAGIKVHQGGVINMHKEDETRMLKTNLKYKNVNMDIINSVKFNTEYEIKMFKEPGMRILKTTPKGKYGEDVNVDNKVDESNVEKLSSQSRQSSMDEPVIKSAGDAVSRLLSIKIPTKARVTGSLR
jgi:hypothetical protein